MRRVRTQSGLISVHACLGSEEMRSHNVTTSMNVQRIPTYAMQTHAVPMSLEVIHVHVMMAMLGMVPIVKVRPIKVMISHYINKHRMWI